MKKILLLLIMLLLTTSCSHSKSNSLENVGLLCKGKDGIYDKDGKRVVESTYSNIINNNQMKYSNLTLPCKSTEDSIQCQIYEDNLSHSVNINRFTLQVHHSYVIGTISGGGYNGLFDGVCVIKEKEQI